MGATPSRALRGAPESDRNSFRQRKKKLLPGAARTQSDEVDFEIMVRGLVNFVLEN